MYVRVPWQVFPRQADLGLDLWPGLGHWGRLIFWVPIYNLTWSAKNLDLNRLWEGTPPIPSSSVRTQIFCPLSSSREVQVLTAKTLAEQRTQRSSNLGPFLQHPAHQEASGLSQHPAKSDQGKIHFLRDGGRGPIAPATPFACDLLSLSYFSELQSHFICVTNSPGKNRILLCGDWRWNPRKLSLLSGQLSK